MQKMRIDKLSLHLLLSSIERQLTYIGRDFVHISPSYADVFEVLFHFVHMQNATVRDGDSIYSIYAKCILQLYATV